MPWTIHVLPEAEAEMMAMPADIRARFLHVSELLHTFGPHQVGMPHIRHLDGKLWEMRMKGRDGIARAVYAA
jgi:phage-related protein